MSELGLGLYQKAQAEPCAWVLIKIKFKNSKNTSESMNTPSSYI